MHRALVRNLPFDLPHGPLLINPKTLAQILLENLAGATLR
jgi:hypothetical protein